MRAAVWLLLALAGCGADGTTCGRGRCGAGAACVSVFGDGRKNQGWNDPRYPNVDNEWWCVKSCPAGLACNGMCLEDPADSNVVVCGGDTVDIAYRSAGKSCLCDASRTCYVDVALDTLEVIDTCYGAHMTLQTCAPNVDCPGGTFHAGDTVPGVRLSFSGNGLEYLYCPAQPSNKLGPLLPTGKTVRIWADTDTCN